MPIHVYLTCMVNSDIKSRNTSPLVQLTHRITFFKKNRVQKQHTFIKKQTNKTQGHFIGK